MTDLAPLPPDIVQGYIAIDGRAVVRVRATEIRVVLAVTGEGPTAQECQKVVDLTIARLKATWAKIGIAPEKIVVDFIAFDYWSRDLDEVKVAVRAQALQAAKSKADVLLGTIFEHRPPAINLQEQTVVHYPHSLYHSFSNAYEESVAPSFRRDIPFIRLPRPRNTYYRGLVGDSDVQPRELPMSPEISVVSTVRLYFQSPAAKPAVEIKNLGSGRLNP
ncbi:MAG: SIMPL domain-containing protein [Planctomycetaceae bacterium]|nr:MAG: SIMPL domain-containing protein [Planctomycetaceae bacterium]